MTTNPDGQEHVNAARTPEARIRLLLDLTDHPNLGEEITYDRRFNTAEWPRNGYCLQRSDVEAVLAELDKVRARSGDLERRMKEASEGVESMVRLFEEYKESAKAEIDELKRKLAALGVRDDDD